MNDLTQIKSSKNQRHWVRIALIAVLSILISAYVPTFAQSSSEGDGGNETHTHEHTHTGDEDHQHGEEAAVTEEVAGDTRPNIILLVADDAGYSDFPQFGGEAAGPNIDSLADIGMKLTNFHVLPTCSPSRSALLSGMDNHINGLGTMEGRIKKKDHAVTDEPGYMGYLNKKVVTIATLLRDAGYNTYHVGKWHLGERQVLDGGQIFYPRGWWPIDRGFEHSYGMLDGGAEHYGSCERASGYCTSFIEDDKMIAHDIPHDYFSADAHTDKAVEYIKADKEANGDQRKPFFLFYADTLVHEPNQVPAEYIRQEHIDHYYAQGWDGMRVERFQKLKDLGIVPQELALPVRYDWIPDWNDESDPQWERLLEEVTDPRYSHMWGIETIDDYKRTLAKKFAVYTGMVEYFDMQVGKLVAELKAIDEYENTVFIFFSDNGGDTREWDIEDHPYLARKGTDNTYDNIGGHNSFVANGPGWGQVANMPLYGAKATVAEGGIRAPLIIAHPAGNIEGGSMSSAMSTVMDVAATVLDYAEVEHPTGVGVAPNWGTCTGTYTDGNSGETREGICPMNGKSIRGILEGETQHVHAGQPIGFELFARTNKALFLEEEGAMWKILKVGDGVWGAKAKQPWKLFDVNVDPSESNDLSAVYPDKFREMIDMYNAYEYNVKFMPVQPARSTDATPGETILNTFAITNTTGADDTFTFTCQSDWPCAVALADETEYVSNLSIPMAAGAGVRVVLAIIPPKDAKATTRNVAHLNVLLNNSPQFSDNRTAVIRVSPEKVAEIAAQAETEAEAQTDAGEMDGDKAEHEMQVAVPFSAVNVPCADGNVILSDAPEVAGVAAYQMSRGEGEQFFEMAAIFSPEAYPGSGWDAPGKGLFKTENDSDYALLHRGIGTGDLEGNKIIFVAKPATKQDSLPCKPVGQVAQLDGYILLSEKSALWDSMEMAGEELVAYEFTGLDVPCGENNILSTEQELMAGISNYAFKKDPNSKLNYTMGATYSPEAHPGGGWNAPGYGTFLVNKLSFLIHQGEGTGSLEGGRVILSITEDGVDQKQAGLPCEPQGLVVQLDGVVMVPLTDEVWSE